jgi:hypothetical protein
MAATRVERLDVREPSAHRMPLVLLICAVGTAGLLRDAWPDAIDWPFVDLHAAFGLLLCLMVVMQFHAADSSAVPLSCAGLQAFCRGLTRLVFLLLYVLFGLDGLVHAAAMWWNSGMQGSARPATIRPPESLQDYLAYGVIALAMIRLLGARIPQRSPTVSTTKESGIRAGRGRGCSAVAAGAGPKSAVTR